MMGGPPPGPAQFSSNRGAGLGNDSGPMGGGGMQGGRLVFFLSNSFLE